jgi:hypothetical protein
VAYEINLISFENLKTHLLPISTGKRFRENGVRSAPVRINGVLKANSRNGASTLFPAGWSNNKIISEVKAATQNNSTDTSSGTLRVRTPAGVLVQINRSGNNVISFFPILE